MCLAAILTFSLFDSQNACSQLTTTLKLNVSLRSKRYNMECNTRVEFKITFTDGTTNEFTMQIPDRDFEDGETYTFPVKQLTYTKTIRSIEAHGIHRDKTSIIFSECQTRGNAFKTANITSSAPCVEGTITDFLGEYDSGSLIKYSISISGLPLTYSLNGTNLSNQIAYILNSKNIRLSAPAGCNPSDCFWQYSTSSSSTWQGFPSNLQGQSEIEFNGNDLFSDFASLVGQTQVRVRLDYGCGQSEILTLTPYLVGPEIVTAEGIKTSCGSENNGKIKVQYSRDLYENETINFSVTEQSSSDSYSYHYGWNDPNLDKDLTNREVTIKGLSIGTYKVRITGYLNGDSLVVYSDDSESFVFNGIVIEKGGEPVVIESISTNDLSCKGGNTGSIIVSASGGSGNYTVRLLNYNNTKIIAESELFGSSETGVINSLSAGDYNVIVIDDNGCESDYVGADIFEPDNFFLITNTEYELASYDENGDDENNGSATVDVSPDMGDYTYIWRENDENGEIIEIRTTPFNSYTLENINSGTYFVSVTNAGGCEVTTKITIPRAPAISISIRQTGNILCSGDNTGELSATVSGGRPPLSFQWYKIDEYTDESVAVGDNNLVISNITAGKYQLKVTDSGNSRTLSDIVYQTEENPIIVTFKTQTLHCRGDQNGFLEATISGGTPPYNYAWYNGSTNLRMEDLPAGHYPFRVTDALGCFKEVVGIVSEPDPLDVQANIKTPTCFGMSDGKISLQINGGNAPYTIKWDSGETTDVISGLTKGNYSVTVSENNGCETIYKTFILDEPNELQASIYEYIPISYFEKKDGKFAIRISGGSAPYTVSCRMNGARIISPESSQMQDDGSYIYWYTKIAPGEYAISAKDNSNCSAEITISVPEAPKLSVTINKIQAISCNGVSDGELLAEVSGGEAPYVYEWFSIEANKDVSIGNTASINNLAAGKYKIKITDKQKFTVTSPVYQLTEPDKISIIFDIVDVICYGGSTGSVKAKVSGGTGAYSYLWNTGETIDSISGKAIGAYRLTVIDDKGCSASEEAVIKSSNPFVINYIITRESCSGKNDASISLNISGSSAPYTYLWSNGSTASAIGNLTSGNYTVVISDVNGCSIDTTFTVAAIPDISAVENGSKRPLGFGYSDGILRVEIIGGTSPYFVRWTDEKDMELNSKLFVNEEYKFFTELPDIPAGNYLLYIEDANHCTGAFSFIMPETPKLEVEIEQTHIISCNGSNDGSIKALAEGGVPYETGLPYNFLWFRNGELYITETSVLSVLPSGEYYLKIIDANGIEAASNTLTLTEPDPLEISFSYSDIKCSRDATGWAEVTVSGGTPPYKYEWSNGNVGSKIDNIGRGKYMVWVHDANGCEISGVVSIIQSNAIEIKSELIEPTCFEGSDGQIKISLSGGEPPYSFHWEDGSTELIRKNLRKGTYTLTVSDITGCGYEVETYILGEPEKLVVDLGEDRELCCGQQAVVKATLSEPVKSFTWYDASSKKLYTGDEYTISEAGIYTVQAITAKGCVAYGQIKITTVDTEISSDFMVASKVPIHDDVYAVNISNPIPDKTEWILPESGDFEVVADSDDALVIKFHSYGVYVIGMKTYLDKCWAIEYKTVQVMDKIYIDDYQDADEPLLVSFSVNPNPSTGLFSVKIELKEESPVELYLVNSAGVLVARKSLSGQKEYTESFTAPSSENGTCILSLIAPNTKKALKVIIH